MEETLFCVFCGATLYGRTKARVSAIEVRKAVARGFSPDENAIAIISAETRMSKAEVRQAFLADVKGLDSDWIICPNCARRIENYSQRLGFLTDPKKAGIIIVVLVILLILVLYSMGIFSR